MTCPTSEQPLVALLGGSFNPPHTGHLRIAIEVYEALAPEGVLFVPCATPPHKPSENMLPFELRTTMLEAALAELAERAESDAAAMRMRVSRVENERQGPSYTADTLKLLAKTFPHNRLAFIMGSEDYRMLPSWKDWRTVAELADLIILPRGADEPGIFQNTTLEFWPEAAALAPPRPLIRAAFRLPHGGKVLYLPQPRLEISSSMIRERWNTGRSLAFLVPQSVQKLLRKNHKMAGLLWQEPWTEATPPRLASP